MAVQDRKTALLGNLLGELLGKLFLENCSQKTVRPMMGWQGREAQLLYLIPV